MRRSTRKKKTPRTQNALPLRDYYYYYLLLSFKLSRVLALNDAFDFEIASRRYCRLCPGKPFRCEFKALTFVQWLRLFIMMMNIRRAAHQPKWEEVRKQQWHTHECTLCALSTHIRWNGVPDDDGKWENRCYQTKFILYARSISPFIYCKNELIDVYELYGSYPGHYAKTAFDKYYAKYRTINCSINNNSKAGA